jgi:hypothetical protein
MKNFSVLTLWLGALASSFRGLVGKVVCTGIRFLRTPRHADA